MTLASVRPAAKVVDSQTHKNGRCNTVYSRKASLFQRRSKTGSVGGVCFWWAAGKNSPGITGAPNRGEGPLECNAHRLLGRKTRLCGPLPAPSQSSFQLQVDAIKGALFLAGHVPIP
jgi:hypothetical protein